jgi:predicted enzyme related to lactoylglutathione lyase
VALSPGTFGWADLLTDDIATAKKFYSELFDWDFLDLPAAAGVDYTMCLVDGQMVCGLMPQPSGVPDADAPPAWNSYVIVDDVDVVAAAAESAGGRVVTPPMDVMTAGRVVTVAGPDSALCAAWQPLEHQGAELFDEPGAITWNELQSRDLEASREFLSRVFGWHWERQPGGLEYWVAHVDVSGEDVCGAMNMPDGVTGHASNTSPSSWVVYFAVEDCDVSAGHVGDLGGMLFLPPIEMGPGKFAGATDPSGAMFYFGSFPDPA